jgi:hypothetical protein
VRKFSGGLCRRASIIRPPTPSADVDGEKEPSLREIINVKVPVPFPISRESSKEILGPCCLFARNFSSRSSAMEFSSFWCVVQAGGLG